MALSSFVVVEWAAQEGLRKRAIILMPATKRAIFY